MLILIGQARFAVFMREMRSRFLDGPLARRNFLTRTPEIECVFNESWLWAVPRSNPREWVKLPRRQLLLASRIGNFLEPGRRRGGHVVPTACGSAARRNVTATREAIPLNRRLRNKATRGQQARKGPEGPM